MVQKVSGKLPEVKLQSLGYQKLKDKVHFNDTKRPFSGNK